MHWKATEWAVGALCRAEGLPVDVAHHLVECCLVGRHGGAIARGPLLREVVPHDPKEGGTMLCGCQLKPCLMQNHDFVFHWLPRPVAPRTAWRPTLAHVTSSTYLRHDSVANPGCTLPGRRTLVRVRFLPIRFQRASPTTMPSTMVSLV